MSEYINEIYDMLVRKPRIALIVDINALRIGKTPELALLKQLKEKFQAFGQVRHALLLTSQQLKSGALEIVQDTGFQVKVIPKGYEDMHFVLEAYDVALSGKVNIMVLGMDNPSLTPLLMACKQILSETIIFSCSELSEKLINSADAIIYPETLEQFTLFESSEPEYDTMKVLVNNGIHSLGGISSEEKNETEEGYGEIDEVLYGPISEDMDEDKSS